MMAVSNNWVSGYGNVKNPTIRMICFPFGGGGASLYRSWHNIFGSDIEICPVHLPGRERRYDEPPVTEINELVTKLLPHLLPLFDRPVIFFGYSMGAAIAYNIASYCIKNNINLKILALICCARKPPEKEQNDESLLNLSDEEFIKHIVQLGGAPQIIFNDSALRKMALKILRSDFMLSSSILEPDDSVLNCPVYALGGIADLSVSVNEIREWARCTHREFHYFILQGGHFFIHDSAAEFYHLIKKIVSAEKEKLPLQEL